MMRNLSVLFRVCVLFALIVLCCGLQTVNVLQFCPFFGNRAPQPQPNLKNCTKYRENSCCRQEEIDATFGKVKSLPGASPECQKYINHLMCYICSPNQNLVYSRERLTVCEEFCDGWFVACSRAILKGSLIRELYPNGKEFCLSRSFLVDTQSKGKCFTYDKAWHTSHSDHPRTTLTFVFLSVSISLTIHILYFGKTISC